MKKQISILFLLTLGVFIYACGGGADQAKDETAEKTTKEQPEMKDDKAQDMEANKGVGEVKNVELNDPLEMDMVKDGKAIYEMKCSACHKLTDQRVVGPGFKGVTDRRTPEWIMNMITNVNVMLAEDKEAQKLLEECLTRMPDQNVSIGDARDILEFMYYNDGKRVPEGAEL
jgi:cytochrome c5